MTEIDLVQRYRYLRGIAARIQTAAFAQVPQSTFVEFGRRLGVVRNGEVCTDDQENKLVGDLAIHTARPGRSRAIDRYARSVAFSPGSDEALVLAALQKAQFTTFQFETRHAVAGAIAYDLLLKQNFHFMDISIGLSAEPKDAFVGRLVEIEGFRMSCLTVVPMTLELLETALPRMTTSIDGPEIDAFQDPRCAIAIYRTALELGYMQRTVLFEVVKELPTAASIAAVTQISDRPPVDLPRHILVY